LNLKIIYEAITDMSEYEKVFATAAFRDFGQFARKKYLTFHVRSKYLFNVAIIKRSPCPRQGKTACFDYIG